MTNDLDNLYDRFIRMSKPSTHRGYYVTARDGSRGRTAWLCGPFQTLSAAMKMVPAVSHGARHHSDDPRMQFATYGAAKLTLPIDRPLPPGRLDLTKVVDDAWIGYVINSDRNL